MSVELPVAAPVDPPDLGRVPDGGVVDLVALIAEHMDTPGGQILTGDQDADPEFTSIA